MKIEDKILVMIFYSGIPSEKNQKEIYNYLFEEFYEIGWKRFLLLFQNGDSEKVDIKVITPSQIETLELPEEKLQLIKEYGWLKSAPEDIIIEII